MKCSMSSSLILFASIFLTSSMYLTRADLISNICSHVTEPKSCEKGLRSDPRSRVQDLIVLGQISIDRSKDATSAARTVARYVETVGNEDSIDLCVSTFDYVIDTIGQCTEFLKNHDIKNLRVYSSTTTSVFFNHCEASFGREMVPEKLKRAIDYAKYNFQVLDSVGAAFG